MGVAEFLDLWWMRLGVLPTVAVLFSVGARLIVIRTEKEFRVMEPEAWQVAPDLVVLSFITLLTGLVENARALELWAELQEATKPQPGSVPIQILEQVAAFENKQTSIALALAATVLVGFLLLLWIRAKGYVLHTQRAGSRPKRPTVRWASGVVWPNVAAFTLFVLSLAIVRIPA